MKNLKDKLKKPVFIWSFIGAVLVGVGLLTFKNIGLKNQNTYLFGKYKEVGKQYVDLSTKYNHLETDKFMDSINISLQYCLDILSLQKNLFNLSSEYDSLENEYINFAKGCLESSKEKREIMEKLILITDEKEFYKEYARYLDSLLGKYELNNRIEDSSPFK